jgi:hypothetical protein
LSIVTLLPWRVRNLADEILSASHYAVNRKRHGRAQQKGRFRILFCVPFYGYTGGAFAVLSAANLLSERCAVSFLTRPTNIMNRYVSPRVRMVDHPDGVYDFCIVESGIDDTIVSQLKQNGARIILTMHGAPAAADGTRNHGYSDEQVIRSFAGVDSIQYVSDVQAPFFDTIGAFHRRKIPNYVLAVKKTKRGRAAGLVCDTTLPHKNAEAGIAAAQLSSASHVEVWGKYKDRRSTNRIHWNGFSSNKMRIYGSFDVLVHLSRLENQPLVILEAMSAGIPCVLAPLPAYAGFRGLEGIYFAPADDTAAAAKAIDQALDCPLAVREGLIRFWEANCSPRAVLAQWLSYLEDISSPKEQGMREIALSS